MSANKQTVQTYIDGFNKNDHAQILSCLTDDIRWTVFGAYRVSGKAAYDANIESPDFTGSPNLKVVRMIEEDDVVMAELTAKLQHVNGDVIHAVMGEVFVMRDAKICERRAYYMVLKENDYK